MANCIQAAFSGGGGGGGLTATNRISSSIEATSFSTSSTSFVSSGMTCTLSTESDGTASVIVSGQWREDEAGQDCHGLITDDGSNIAESARVAAGGGAVQTQGLCSNTNLETDGSVLVFVMRTSGSGNALLIAAGGLAPYTCTMTVNEVY